MNRFLLLLLFPLLSVGCGPSRNTDTTDEIPKYDPFRENVLAMRRTGLLKNVPDKELDSLINVYRKDSLNGLEELLSASGDLLEIRAELNGRTVDQVYRQVCDTIGMRWPDLKCDEVQTAFLPNFPGGNDSGWTLLRVRFGETWYERRLYYFRDWPIDELLYYLFNTRMADLGMNERLALIQFACSDCPKTESDFMGNTDTRRFGYLRVNKTQQDTLLAIRPLRIDPEDNFSIFTTAQIKTTVEQFEATGLVGSKDEGWYKLVRQEILRSSIHGKEHFYDMLDTLFCTVSFDTINPYDPYGEMLQKLSKASRGNFTPGAISDEEVNPVTRTVRFSLGSKVYERDAEQHGGLLSPEIIDDVNKALEEQKAGGAFYTVLSRDKVCILVYIEDKNVEKAKSSGLFTEFTKGAPERLKELYRTSPVM